jgi:hypothetical protein
VFGSNPSQDKSLWPDLTNRRECLDMQISDPAIASLNRSSTISIGGVSEGATTWDLLLGGSSDQQAPLPDVNVKIKVSVASVIEPPPPPPPPPTSTEEVDVLFQVSRRVTSGPPFPGTSDQMCNDYSITITDPKGRTYSGTSVARGGSYETTLFVADGYTYSIGYGYAYAGTSGCQNTGTVTGKFDVKKAISNFVKVETPPCQAN